MSQPDDRHGDDAGPAVNSSANTSANAPANAAGSAPPASSAQPAGSAETEGADDGSAPRPSPRTVLITGPGGAGRTTVAAATALASARDGRRTLLLSGETPAVLEAVLGTAVAAAPAGSHGPDGSPAPAGTEIPAARAPLSAVRVDSGDVFRAGVTALQDRAGTLLELLGAEALDHDELTELPGAGTFALLRTLHAAHTSGEWDTLVVDLPPTTAALHMLALPRQLRRYLRRLVPPERQAARALRPALAQLVGVPMPAAALYETADRWARELADVQGVLESPATAVRVVTEPGPLAAEALRSVRAGLGLYGMPLEAVVANRVLPAGSTDPWLASMSGRQQHALKGLRAECGTQGVPLCELPHLGHDPCGADDLTRLAGAAGAAAPSGTGGTGCAGGAGGGTGRGAPVRGPGRIEDRLAQDGLLVWRMPLPAVRKDELTLVRRGDELILGVGPYRRAIALPSALRRCRVVGAALDGGELRVRCAPDPALWPEGTPGRPEDPRG